MTSGDCNVTTCCVVKVLSEGDSKASLLHHFLRAFNSSSPPAAVKEEPIDATQIPNSEKACLTSRCVTEDPCCSCRAEESNRGRLKGFPFMCGETKAYVNRNVQLVICDRLALRELETCLDNVSLSFGSAMPYLYVWKSHSSFVWHLDDVCELNKTETNVSKRKWYLIPLQCVSLLHTFVHHHLQLQVGMATCRTLLGRTSIEGQLQEIQVSVVTREAGELRIMCHSGCVTGPSIAEAAAYAMEVRFVAGSPLVPALSVAEERDHLLSPPNTPLQSHSNNMPVASSDEPHAPFVPDVHIDPSRDNSKLQEQGAEVSDTMSTWETPVTAGNEKRRVEHSYSTPFIKKRVYDCMGLVECPDCDRSFKGTKDRLRLLLNHVTRCHKKKMKTVVWKTIQKYYPLWLRFVDGS